MQTSSFPTIPHDQGPQESLQDSFAEEDTELWKGYGPAQNHTETTEP